MSDKQAVKLLLGPHDPARTMAQVADPPTVARILAAAGDGRPVRSHRRLLIAGLALTVTAGAIAGAAVLAPDPAPDLTAGPPPVAIVNDHRLAFWPVVRPMAFTGGAALVPGADTPLAAARADETQGRYQHITTVSWTATFDDTTGDSTRYVAPQRKDIWFDAEGAGRITTTQLPYVYLNEASRRYWEPRHARTAQATTPVVNDLGPGLVGSTKPLPATDDAMDGLLGLGSPAPLTAQGAATTFGRIQALYTIHVIPSDARARLLARLARTAGVEQAGRTTDRAGRAGIGFTARSGDLTQILVFDPSTGELLGWDAIDRTTGVVQSSMLLLAAEHTDRLG